MALTFFWRFNGSPLDGTHDYTAGTTGPQVLGTGGSLDATAGLAEKYGLHVATNMQGGRSLSALNILNATADSATYPSNLVYSAAVSFKSIGGTSFQSFQRDCGPGMNSTISTETLGVVAGLSPAKLAFRLRSSYGGTQQTLDLVCNSVTLQADQWYGVVLRLDVPNNKARIELYTHAGTYHAAATLVDSAESIGPSLTNYILSNILSTSGAVRVLAQAGTHDANPVVFDNWMIADTYDENLQNNLTLGSYTDWDPNAGQGSPAHIFPVNELLAQKATLSGGNV